MKKHLVILCGVYYPNPSPTGLCAKRYAKLLCDKYDISIIFIKDGCSSDTTDEDGNRLYPIENVSKSKMPKIFSRAFAFMQMKTLPLGNMTWYRKSAYKKLIEINKKRKIDAVFSICSPLAAHIAAADFKKKFNDVTHLAYSVDMYSIKERICPFYMSQKKLRSFEISALSKPDFIFLSEELYNSRSDLKSANKNTKALGYVLPDEQDVTPVTDYRIDGTCNCVYAGRFYKDIRNPEYMLKTFRLLEKDIVLHLYSFGCEDIVNNYLSCDNIKKQTPVSPEEIKGVYQGADILIGIGNTLSEFLPSKIYEYIMTRKPIVFFNPTNEKNAILDKYPLCLQLSMKDSFEKNTSLIKEFVLNFHQENITYEDIYRIYYENTPHNVKETLLTFEKGD